MKSQILPVLNLACILAGGLDVRPSGPATEVEPRDCVVLPGPTNAVQFRIYTNASPDAPHLFNTFDIEAYGDSLLKSPGVDAVKRSLTNSAPNLWLHNILVDGKGPVLATTNNMTVIEQASGPEWKYVGLDVSAAYRSQLESYKRGILFVAPDLFVVFDHLVAKEPASFQMVLHPPAVARVDPVWHDLRLDLPKGAFRVHAPGTKKTPRFWRPVESAADQLLAHTVTVQLGPTNKLATLDMLTVFAVYRAGEKKDDDYAFRLVESNTSIGARIHRDGWPTLVAFKLDSAAPSASITGFGFNGPVAVDVFKPKRKVQ
jgi:hypothetical protein